MPFDKLGLPLPVLKGVRAAGYVQPTPVQQRAIPIVLTGQDLIAAAQTGTGKTAAFVLPILARLLGGPPRLRALVLTPTRELAAQVETNARDYARFTELRVGVVYGGVPLPPQERMLKQQGVDLLVATPGRLLDLHDRLALRLDYIEILVLDEADRMVDMGFAPDLKRILRHLPTQRQTMLFSATMPPELNRVAQEALHDPARVDLAPPSRPAAGITQAVYPISRHLKTDLLDDLITRGNMGSVLVFTRTKHGADRLARSLVRRGHSIATLHGNRSQSQRERALGDLRRGRVQVLVATDIASRGLDVEGITHVINYDVPHTPEDYVHRIGRTGRVDAVGDAFTLMSPEEGKQMTAIERFLGRSIPRVTLPDFDYKARPREERGRPGDEGPSRRPGRGGPSRGGDRRGGFGNGAGDQGRGGRGGGRDGGRFDRAARSSGRPARSDRPSASPSAGASPESGGGHGRRPRKVTAAERMRRRRI
ncbi:MAG TPA: DEAD/DEAH box helicase [Candidatus Eisenbacteria bacterium]